MTLGVVELFADAGFALEAVEEDGVGFHVGVRNLEGNLCGCRAMSVARKMEAIPLRATGASMR